MTLRALFELVRSSSYIELENGASYQLLRNGTHLTVLFQESNGKLDWRANFAFAARPYKDMNEKWWCHRGFLRMWKACEEQLEATLLNPEVTDITIAGYSHGAALAVLCHEWCVFHRPDIAASIHGYGFGCPRVLWRANKKVLDRWCNFTVVRCCKDLVTHLPPRLFGYKHVGLMRHIGRGAGYRPIKSHYPDKYLTELRLLEDKYGI